MIERWRWEEREHLEQFAGEPFATVDPGVDGYVMGYADPKSEQPSSYCHALEIVSLVDLMMNTGARVLVTEGQYIGMITIAHSVLELGFRHGMTLGYAAALLDERKQRDTDLHLFEVKASTWQAYQRRMLKITAKKQKGDGIKLAIERAEKLFGGQSEWESASKAKQGGMASAVGMGDWWRSLW